MGEKFPTPEKRTFASCAIMPLKRKAILNHTKIFTGLNKTAEEMLIGIENGSCQQIRWFPFFWSTMLVL